MTLCAGPECNRPARALQLCTTHYAQQRRGKPLTPTRPQNPSRRCTAPQCNRRARARGYCNSHWHQWRRTGRTWPIKPSNRGRRGWAKTDTTGLIAELEFLTGTDHPARIAQRLGFDPDTLAKRLNRAGRPDLATHYWKAAA